MCGRPRVAPSPACARTCSSETGMPSAAIAATMRSTRVSLLSLARSSSASELGVLRVDEVAEQVDADAAVGAGDLDAADQVDPELEGGGRGSRPPGIRVVVGECDHVESGLARPTAPRPPASWVPSLAEEWVWRSMGTGQG